MQNTIGSWLEKHGLGAYTGLFESRQIGPDILHTLTEADLRELDIPLGDRKRFLLALQNVPASGVVRRQLTVLICDLVDSTGLSERLDIEAYRECLATFREICHSAIDFYDGYIYQYRGDSAIAYFSYPRGQEQSAARAAHAALTLIDSLKRYREQHPHAPALEARVGLATGMVIVGAELEQGTLHENAVGVTPNLAARLQALAAPGQIILSAMTHQLVETRFVTHALPRQHLKGLSQEVRPYLLERARNNPSETDPGAEPDEWPCFGREAPLAALRQAWERSGAANSFLQILGDAGIGKSRLLREFRHQLMDQGSTCLAYHCSPFYQHSALYPVVQHLRRTLQLRTRTSGELSLDQLRHALRELGVEEDAQVLALAELLNVRSDLIKHRKLTPKHKVDLFAAILALLRSACSNGQVLLYIEDVHWIDPSTLELLRRVLENQQDLNCLILISARPEFQWAEDDPIDVQTLHLTPLPDDISARLVEEILGPLPPHSLVEEIVRKTAGIPLFIEETARAVRASLASAHPDNATRAQQVGVPPTLNDSLMAKLDRLGNLKFVALVAAVIGPQFSQQVLESLLHESHSSLEQDLQVLVHQGVLHTSATAYGLRYSFAHGLLQDVAYGTLLKNTRAKIHSDVADALIAHAKQTHETGPELIAHHLTQSERTEEAVDYWIKAGRLASERSALQEAVVHFRTALALMETLPETPENVRIKLMILQGLAAPLLGTTSYRSKEVKEVANLAVKLCQQARFENEIPVFLYTIWIGEQGDGNHQYALNLARDFLSLARQHKDTTAQMVAHRALAWSELNLGNLAQAQSHLRSSRTLYDADQHDALVFIYGTDHRIGIGCGEVQSLWGLGFPDSASRIAEATIASADESELAVSRFLAYQYAGCLLNSLCRRWNEAAHYAQLLLRLGSENKLQQALLVGAFYRDMLDVVCHGRREAFDSAMRIITSARQLGYLYMMPLWYTLLADACLRSGLHDEAQHSLSQAQEIVEKTQEHWYLPEIYRIEAELHYMRTGAYEGECETLLRRAIEVAGKQQAKSWELRARTTQQRLAPTINPQDALALAQCCVWFSEGDSLDDLQQARQFVSANSL